MAGGKRWIGAGLAVVVIAVVAFVVAQGGGDGGGPLNAIAKAAEVTQRVPGGHADLKATVTSSTSPEGLTETGTMAFDQGGRAEGTLTVRGHSTGKEVELTVIADGPKVYASSDALDSIPEGKKWMGIDYSAAVKGMGSSPAEAGPQEGLKVLERVQGSEEVGKEDVDGVSTTHYRGTFPATEEVFGVKNHFSAPRADVWIDSQDRVRRMRIVITGSLNEGEGSTTVEEDIDFTDFGRVPKIELPPADEVFDATSEIESQVQSAAEGD
jgi:LppX_LprAFG lipoprotein